jgi:ribosome-binding protein aMBF1 (putative translation factor)
MPLSWPLNYPSGLVLPSTVVIGKACAKFPVQTETLPFCKFIVSRLTPHFGAEVREGRMRAELALFLIDELLHYLLVYNCDSDSERYRLEKDIKNSPDWLRLVRKVLAPAKSARLPVRRNEQPTTRQRVNVSLARAEGPPQLKRVRAAPAKPTRRMRIATNIKRHSTDCGWSQHQLAEKADIEQKLVVSHEKGRSTPRPSTLKKYADTFSKALGRPIAASDLEK